MTAVELLPDPPHRRRELPARARPDELLGLLVDRLPRAARAATRRPARAASRCASSRGWSRRCTAPGIEVILDVVYNHTAEGNHLGPMLAFKGVDNASYYRLMPDDPRYYMDFTGTGQHAQPGASVGAAADHGLAAVLRHRLPRRRVPLRPRVGARARVLRGRPALGVLRHDPPGSGALAGEADRRAVGRRARRLPGRQLPRAVGGVERPLPRHDARLLARAGERRRVRVALHRLERPLPVATAARRSRRSTSSRRTTASRCATSSRTTTSTTRRTARTTGTAPTTTARGTAASRATTDDPDDQRAARAAAARTSSTTLFLSQGVPMLLGGDELGRTQGGNNNAWCQDNEISWFDWDERRRASLLEFTRRLIRAAPGASGVPARDVPRRAARCAARACRTSGGSAPTAGG